MALALVVLALATASWVGITHGGRLSSGGTLTERVGASWDYPLGHERFLAYGVDAILTTLPDGTAQGLASVGKEVCRHPKYADLVCPVQVTGPGQATPGEYKIGPGDLRVDPASGSAVLLVRAAGELIADVTWKARGRPTSEDQSPDGRVTCFDALALGRVFGKQVSGHSRYTLGSYFSEGFLP